MTQMLHHRLEVQQRVCRVIKKDMEIWCHGYLKYLPPLLYKVAKSVKSWLVITSCNVRHNTEVCNVEVRPMSRLDHCRDGPMLKLVQCRGIGQMSRHWSNVEALVQCRSIGPMSKLCSDKIWWSSEHYLRSYSKKRVFLVFRLSKNV